MKYFLLSVLFVAPAFAITKADLNQQFHLQIKQSAVTQNSAHKLPDFYINDNTINLLALSETIVEDLRSTPTKTPMSTLDVAVLDARNNIGLELLNTIKPAHKGITRDEAQQILDLTHEHPVVGIAALEKYDPINPANNQRRHGFCFGRADFIYFELLKRGYPKTIIFKLFQAGAISADPTFGRPWSNHIVTLVKAKEGGWYALDPFYNLVMTPAEWAAKNRSFAKANRTVLFLGNPERLYTQGSVNTLAGIQDDTFPLGRAKVTENGQTYESLFIFKDDFFKAYYKDMIAAVLETNTGSHAEYFCKQSLLCK